MAFENEKWGKCFRNNCILSYNYADIFFLFQWFPGDVGFMTSFAVAGYGLGGVIWNPVETAFVNPQNIAVESVPGEEDK